MTDRVDLLVAGGGFAGSLTALVARSFGLSVLLVDRGVHPRFSIGESSTPAGNMVLASLAREYGLDSLLPLARYGTWREHHPAIGVGAKRGFSYFHHAAGEAWRQKPGHATELMVAASGDPLNCDTHWLRADVDGFLFGLARESGVACLTGSDLTQIRRSDGRWSVGIMTRAEDGRCPGTPDSNAGSPPQRVIADIILDATGANPAIRDALGAGTGPPMLTHTSAAFTHVTGLKPWQTASGLDPTDHPFPCDQAALHHVGPDGWMWELRFDSGRTSVGVVTQGTIAPDLLGWARRFPSLGSRLAEAELCPDPGRIHQTGRLQRRVALAGGDGWGLLPFSAGFVDPLHSTGIAHSLVAIERIASVLKSGSGDFRGYGESVLVELDHLDGMVSACYRCLPDFAAFSASTMLYFLGSIRFERLRLRGDRGLFLGADDPDMIDIVARARHRGGADDFKAWLAGELVRLDPEGVLRPEIHNMYPHTVPPGW